MRDINITPVLNGYICRVGCQTVTFISRQTMLLELGRYLENPRQVEEEYLKSSINRDMLKNSEPQCEAQRSMAACEVPAPPGLRR